MKKDMDGANDEYEKSAPLPLPLLDEDDSEEVIDEFEELSEEAVFDISGGRFDPFETQDGTAVETDSSFDVTSGKYDTFSLAENVETETDDAVYDILSGSKKEEAFPLLDDHAQDPLKKHGEAGDFIPPKVLVTAKKRGGLITAVIICSLLILFLIWAVAGIAYTNNYNKYVYSEFRHGVSMTSINPDFSFFVTVDNTTLPVVKSETEKRFTTFNGFFFMPGTLTCANDTTVCGSSRLLPALDSSLIGKLVTVESHSQKREYEIYAVEEYTPQENNEDFIIYTDDKSSPTGYIALYARPVKKTASHL